MAAEAPQPEEQSLPTRPCNRDLIRGKIAKTIDRFERYPLLDIVCEQLLLRLSPRLSAQYCQPLDLQIQTKNILRFGHYLENLDEGSLLCLFEAREWRENGLVVLDPKAAAANAQFLLGGGVEDIPPTDSWTVSGLDRSLARQMVNVVLSELSAAFLAARAEIGRVGMTCDRVEVSPEFAVIVDPQTPVCIAGVVLSVPGRDGEAVQYEGKIDIVMPLPMLEPVRHFLTAAYRGVPKPTDMVWTRHITGALMGLPLPIDAELERVSLPLDRVMRWKVGDFLPLSADTNTPLELRLTDETGKVTVLSGKMGALRGNKAIKLLDDTASEFGQPLQAFAAGLGVWTPSHDPPVETPSSDHAHHDDLTDFGLDPVLAAPEGA